MESGGSMTDLLTLAERCEQATGPDRELDVAIAVAAGVIRERDGNLCYATGNDSDYVLERGYYDLEGGPQELPYFTASLDAAMALVPEGWEGSLPVKRKCYAELWRPGTVDSNVFGKGPAAALALCAAALRARASQDTPSPPEDM
jgi:hypothetical protein